MMLNEIYPLTYFRAHTTIHQLTYVQLQVFWKVFGLPSVCQFPLLPSHVVHAAVFPGALDSLWWWWCIGVSECTNRTYISSCLCPVFSIPSPPLPHSPLFLTLSLIWLSDCTFSLCCGIPSSCTWQALQRALCVNVCTLVCLNVSFRKHLPMKWRKHEVCIVYLLFMRNIPASGHDLIHSQLCKFSAHSTFCTNVS